MKLLAELCESVQVIEEGAEGNKSTFITGPFMQYDTPNRNKRVYSRPLMEREVNRYITEKVRNNRAYGELNHPSGPTINLDRVSHLITDLRVEDKGIVWGKAKITSTPVGDIVKGLLKDGANLGVSSRGLGSLKAGNDGIMEVQDDFRLVTAADIVADPSAYDAYVKGIMESVDYYYNAVTGTYAERVVEQHHETMKKMTMREINEGKIRFFEQLLQSLSKKTSL
jgi:hypothetical protein